jgi:hypothetical protein
LNFELISLGWQTHARRFIIERILHLSQQSCSDGGVMRRLNLIGLVLVSLFLALPLHAPYAQQQSVRVATTTPRLPLILTPNARRLNASQPTR